MYCRRVCIDLYKNYILYYNVHRDYFGQLYVYTKFHLVSVSYMHIYVPIVMYGLRVFTRRR